MQAICPYCKKKDCLKDVVYIHAESYGGSLSHSRCVHCNQMLEHTTKVKVVIVDIRKSDKEYGSWG